MSIKSPLTVGRVKDELPCYPAALCSAFRTSAFPGLFFLVSLPSCVDGEELWDQEGVGEAICSRHQLAQPLLLEPDLQP